MKSVHPYRAPVYASVHMADNSSLPVFTYTQQVPNYQAISLFTSRLYQKYLPNHACCSPTLLVGYNLHLGWSCNANPNP